MNKNTILNDLKNRLGNEADKYHLDVIYRDTGYWQLEMALLDKNGKYEWAYRTSIFKDNNYDHILNTFIEQGKKWVHKF